MSRPYIPGAVRPAALASLRADVALAELEAARTAAADEPYNYEAHEAWKAAVLSAVDALDAAGLMPGKEG